LRRGHGEPVRVIAEFKRASPSKGPIRPDAEPEEIVRQYEEGGASAISVLTDEKYFDGRLSFLPRVRATVSLPILRKDFVIDPYQVVEARANGADAVLLIAAALEDTRLRDLYQCVREQGMRALVEVHDVAEAERAVEMGAEIIGVNHRNLATFEVDLSLTGRLAGIFSGDIILVGESGIRGPADVEKLGEDGAHAVLVGESLMRAESPGKALKQLRGEA
jgi:indole-3-glycerol phosphate synthase